MASQVNTKLSGFSTKFNELKSATAQLSSGASELNTGMSTFNSQGIQKLVSSLSSSQLKEIANRLEATADASKQTVFVGGKTSAMSGESKIIFKTEEVK